MTECSLDPGPLRPVDNATQNRAEGFLGVTIASDQPVSLHYGEGPIRDFSRVAHQISVCPVCFQDLVFKEVMRKKTRTSPTSPHSNQLSTLVSLLKTFHF